MSDAPKDRDALIEVMHESLIDNINAITDADIEKEISRE